MSRTNPVMKNETGCSQKPPKMNITIHAPVKVRLKKLFKTSVYYSLLFVFDFLEDFLAASVSVTASTSFDFDLDLVFSTALD